MKGFLIAALLVVSGCGLVRPQRPLTVDMAFQEADKLNHSCTECSDGLILADRMRANAQLDYLSGKDTDPKNVPASCDQEQAAYLENQYFQLSHDYPELRQATPSGVANESACLHIGEEYRTLEERQAAIQLMLDENDHVRNKYEHAYQSAKNDAEREAATKAYIDSLNNPVH